MSQLCTAAAFLLLAAAAGADGRTDAVVPVKTSSLQELVRASPLHHAAFWGELERIRELLDSPCASAMSAAGKGDSEGEGKNEGGGSG